MQNLILNPNLDTIREYVASEPLYVEDMLFGYHEYEIDDQSNGEALKFGVEFEIGDLTSEVDFLNAIDQGLICYNDGNFEISVIDNDGDAPFLATYDSTAFIEFVSHVLSVEQVEEYLPQIAELSQYNGRAHGNHFHINGRATDGHLFGLICAVLSDDLFAISGRAFREWNHWSACKRDGLKGKRLEQIALYCFYELFEYGHGLIRPSTRYNTIEYRGFKAFENPRHVLANFYLLLAMVRATNRVLEDMKFENGFYYAFRDDLINYCDLKRAITHALEREGVRGQIDYIKSEFADELYNKEEEE